MSENVFPCAQCGGSLPAGWNSHHCPRCGKPWRVDGLCVSCRRPLDDHGLVDVLKPMCKVPA